MTQHDHISQHLDDSMSQWKDSTSDPAIRQAMERSTAAHHALADSPGVTFEAHEDIVIVLHPGFELLDTVGPYHFPRRHDRRKRAPRDDGDGGRAREKLGRDANYTRDHPRGCTGGTHCVLIPVGDTGVLVSYDRARGVIRGLGRNPELVTSVCSGLLALAAAGLLDGRRATSHWTMRHLLSGYGEIEVDELVVEDGNVLTAAGVTAGMDIAIRLVARSRGDVYAQFLELGAEYAPEPPFGVGEPDIASPELTARTRDFSAPLEEQLRGKH